MRTKYAYCLRKGMGIGISGALPEREAQGNAHHIKLQRGVGRYLMKPLPEATVRLYMCVLGTYCYNSSASAALSVLVLRFVQ